ncbi:MAG: exodeoxyribonuclease VII large subunit [Nostocaceae cyanobacterium]|nr:exodeoxyribonuclease VII large subunit [Nostocaceae cyanobacterium]
MSPDTAVSVAGLTQYIQTLLAEDENLRQIWVIGEVSSTSRHRSGLFFTLQDPDGVAAIKCVVWNNLVPKLMQLPVAGEQLIILGSIRLYPQRGEYQMQVWQALPAGEGLQALRLRQLQNRLQAEGLFDSDRKRPLPPHPHTIAIVTSPTAAAWGDMQKTLRGRYPGLQVLFSPAVVQGEQAPDSIVSAIERVERDGRAEVLILARGGGAVEDLACFNDERVVRAVANSPIPVITGIGHQRDESLTDLVADVCAHTPTAAAEIVVPALDDLYKHHQQRVVALQVLVHSRLLREQRKLQGLKTRLLQLRLDRQVDQELRSHSWNRQRLVQVMEGRLLAQTQRLQMLREKLTSLDPQAVLGRGYAVVRGEDGGIVRVAEDVAVGEELVVQLGRGEVKVKVVEINRQEAKDAKS